MGKKKSSGLDNWMESQGFIAGRKWKTQRLPANQIEAIRYIGKRHGLGASAVIDQAFQGSPFAREYAAGLVLVPEIEGQESLAL